LPQIRAETLTIMIFFLGTKTYFNAVFVAEREAIE
jgi:hypothetical protein